MTVSVFAKPRKTREGKNFTSYIGRLRRKNGEEITVSVNFVQGVNAPAPIDCPMNIDVDKNYASLAERLYSVVNEVTGEVTQKVGHTLWVKAWTPSSTPYIDHSLDDFED